MQDEFAVISDLARAEDPLVMRMFLSYFRIVLEELLLNPPPSLACWQVPLADFDLYSLDQILKKLQARGPPGQWQHLVALKNVGNLGSHIHLFQRWRDRTLALYKKPEALPSLAAALRGCRVLGIDVPCDVRTFWERVYPTAVAEAAVDVAPDVSDAYPPDEGDETFGRGGGAVCAAAAPRGGEERLRLAQAALADADSMLCEIARLVKERTAGRALAEDETLTIAAEENAVEVASSCNRLVAARLRELGLDDAAIIHDKRACELAGQALRLRLHVGVGMVIGMPPVAAPGTS
jgi:hypothetical protein